MKTKTGIRREFRQRIQASKTEEPPRMELFIETLTGTAFELRVSPFETIMSVKAKIQRLEGEVQCSYRLIVTLLSLFNQCVVIVMSYVNIRCKQSYMIR